MTKSEHEHERKVSSAQEDYLESLLRLEQGREEGVSLSELAARVGVSAPSASDVVRRLRDGGWVERAPRGLIRLTAMGRAYAEKIAGRHRMIKRFLTEVLGVRPEIAEGDACRAEHAWHTETYSRLEEFMNQMEAQAMRTEKGKLTLGSLGKGQRGTLVGVAGGHGAQVRLAALGLRVGVEVEVLQNSGRGPVMVRVGNARVAIGRGLANRVLVTLTSKHTIVNQGEGGSHGE